MSPAWRSPIASPRNVAGGLGVLSRSVMVRLAVIAVTPARVPLTNDGSLLFAPPSGTRRLSQPVCHHGCQISNDGVGPRG